MAWGGRMDQECPVGTEGPPLPVAGFRGPHVQGRWGVSRRLQFSINMCAR